MQNELSQLTDVAISAHPCFFQTPRHEKPIQQYYPSFGEVEVNFHLSVQCHILTLLNFLKRGGLFALIFWK